MIQSSTRRALNFCSSEELLQEELNLIENVAVCNGWERQDAIKFIKRTEQKVFRESFLKLRDPVQFEEGKMRKREDELTKTRMVIPFPGQNMACQMRRICGKYGISPAFTSGNTIKSKLVHLKDPIVDSDKTHVVYKIPLNCGKCYIGETGRKWKVRMSDHKGYIKGNNVRDSAILEHLLECSELCGEVHPGVEWDNCKLLAHECNKQERLATESLYLKLNSDSVVNRNLGGLDPVWDKIMGQLSSERKNVRPTGRPGQAMRLERRRRSLVSGQMRSEVLGVRNDTTVKVVDHDCDLTIVKVVV